MHDLALPCAISCEIRPLRRSASMFPDRRINLVSHFIALPCSLAIFDEAGRSLSSILGRFKIFWEIGGVSRNPLPRQNLVVSL
jgi:hypothetical protein